MARSTKRYTWSLASGKLKAVMYVKEKEHKVADTGSIFDVWSRNIFNDQRLFEDE